MSQKYSKLPTHVEWLQNWFDQHNGTTTMEEISKWMPNGLYRHKKELINALQFLECNIGPDGRIDYVNKKELKLCNCGCGEEAKYMVTSYDYDPRKHDLKGAEFIEPCCESAKNYIVSTGHELGFPDATVTKID